ncbi:MAG: ATP-grasp domain-containing protein [Bdellovibrionales bacterium]|nr:ATP-grasp domain-containing protein [Bdellovibrionales bacterium]
MTSIYRIAAFENLESLLSEDRDSVLHFVSSRSPFATLIRANVSEENIRSLDLSEREPLFFNDRDILLSNPEILRSMKKEADAVLLGNRSSRELEKIIAELDLSLVSVKADVREQFEDKCFFHDFLLRKGLPCPRGSIIAELSQLSQEEFYPGVLQVSQSQSGVGTYFVGSPDESERLVTENELEFPLLLRKFVHGAPYGVTVLCGHGQVLVSAVRRQCSLRIANREIFCGVQWIPKSDLSLSEASLLERAVIQLGGALRDEGFLGVANVDFMLTEEGPLFLECNPRLSGATWQLAQEPALFHGLSFLKEYSSVFLSSGPSCSRLHLPESSFRGSTFDFDFMLLGQPDSVFPRRGLRTAGVYQFGSTEVQFLGEDLELLEVPRSFLLLPGALPGESLSLECGLGIALSDFPLYKILPERALLNKYGVMLKEEIAKDLL